MNWSASDVERPYFAYFTADGKPIELAAVFV
jgi:hypothetical protein